jgi:hypothetical protein
MPSEPDFPDYFRFHHTLVRDLCWTLSPSFDLLGELPPHHRFMPPQPAPVLRQWLEHLQCHPQALEAFIGTGPHQRLGHHFERLVLFYLTHAPAQPLRVLDHNRRIYTRDFAGNPVTVGELDFLLASPTGTVHLETAVKFYLGVEHAGEIRWLGPNLQDRLDRKLRHLREHQLPRSQLLETEADKPFQRHFWVKGILFQPWQQNLTVDLGLLTQPIEHRWLTCAQALEVVVDGEWMCLPKPHWLGCGVEDLQEQQVTKARIQQHFAHSDRVLMMCHRELAARRLIVPDTWPDAARAALASYGHEEKADAYPLATLPSRSI